VIVQLWPRAGLEDDGASSYFSQSDADRLEVVMLSQLQLANLSTPRVDLSRFDPAQSASLKNLTVEEVKGSASKSTSQRGDEGAKRENEWIKGALKETLGGSECKGIVDFD
jgi:hypothetical protein